jgi:pimeloyl-ACP methyl ester carboxylesterase
VFSSAGTNCAFGWGSWELDTTMEKLAKAGKMREIIMVGVDNNGATRLDEYSGRHSGTNRTGKTRYEKYAEFLITELKPWVDKSFRTQPEAANTAVMGSSMGGLCSVVLAWEHPEVFGGAASLSGAFMMNRKEFVEGQLERYKGKPKTFRLYLDSGTIDFTGGDDGRKLTGKVAAEFQRIGWGTNLQSFTDSAPLNERQLEDVGLRRDKWPEAQVSQHNEFYWRLRAWRPLTFLFPPDHARK